MAEQEIDLSSEPHLPFLGEEDTVGKQSEQDSTSEPLPFIGDTPEADKPKTKKPYTPRTGTWGRFLNAIGYLVPADPIVEEEPVKQEPAPNMVLKPEFQPLTREELARLAGKSETTADTPIKRD